VLRPLRIALGLLAGLVVIGVGALALGLSSRGSSPSAVPVAAPAAPAPAPSPASAPAPAPAPAPSTAVTRASASAPTRRPGAERRSARPAPAHPVPHGWFAVSPGAPSDAQVAAELAQEQVFNRQLTTGFQTALASDFTDYGLGLACGGLLGTSQLGVANLTLPCGTLVTFRYRGRVLRVPVIDRGPYIVGRLWDLTGATAAELGFPGLDQIQWKIG